MAKPILIIRVSGEVYKDDDQISKVKIFHEKNTDHEYHVHVVACFDRSMLDYPIFEVHGVQETPTLRQFSSISGKDMLIKINRNGDKGKES